MADPVLSAQVPQELIDLIDRAALQLEIEQGRKVTRSALVRTYLMKGFMPEALPHAVRVRTRTPKAA
jgi:hypothetical protein